MKVHCNSEYEKAAMQKSENSLSKANEDSIVWELIKAGDSKAFEKVFRLHYSSLLNYGMRFNKDEEEIKDCIQTLFLTIWERKGHLGSSDSIRNYLLASLRRLILKRLKDSIRFVDFEGDNLDFQIELSIEASLIHSQTFTENTGLLKKAIEGLPSRQKEALYLKFYDERSFAEIALIMNVSTRAVYKLIYKALESLNKELAPHATREAFYVELSLVFASSAISLVSAGSLS